MTPKEFNAANAKNPLWKVMNPDNYRRGLEAQREVTLDDDVDDEGDEYEEHMREECRAGRFV